MGFSAMLAEEYILIVPFAYHLQSGLNPAGRSPAAKAYGDGTQAGNKAQQ
jgi:hypothetical protein